MATARFMESSGLMVSGGLQPGLINGSVEHISAVMGESQNPLTSSGAGERPQIPLL